MKQKSLQVFVFVLLSLLVLATTSESVLSVPRKKQTATTTATTATTITTPTEIPASTPTVAGKKVLGFTTYYYSGDISSYNSMTANAASIDEIATATHIVDGLGNITGTVPTSQITYANSSNITPLVLLGNNFDGSVAKTLLENPANRKNCINNLINIIKSNGYKGVNIDLEGVYYNDRAYYTAFLSEVSAALKPLGYIVSASVPAKTYDSTTNSWNGAYDYASIAKYVDQLLLMTYDEHYPGGSPGSIASIGWVTNVVNYAMTVVPKEKIYFGVAAYGYDWWGSNTKAYSIISCYNLAKTYGATIQWDDASKSSYFKYTDSNGVAHTVWFENAQSVGYKLDLVNSSGVAGIGIWRLGLENADYWTTIKNKLGR